MWEKIVDFFFGSLDRMLRLPLGLSLLTYVCSILESKYPGIISNSFMHHGLQVGAATETGFLAGLMLLFKD